jgi:hypothetical protein
MGRHLSERQTIRAGDDFRVAGKRPSVHHDRVAGVAGGILGTTFHCDAFELLFWELFDVNLCSLFGVRLGHGGAGGVVGRDSGYCVITLPAA